MEENDISLDIYRSEVEKDAKAGTDYLFHNEGDAHALIICANIFKNAEKEIRIAANQLYNDQVVNKKDYIDSMKGFLDKAGTILKILITKAPDSKDVKKDNTFYGMLFEHPAYKEGRVTIKEGRGKSFHDENDNMINFCTADDRMFRYENDIVNRKAVANFGDPVRSKGLREIFDSIYDNEELTYPVFLTKYFQYYPISPWFSKAPYIFPTIQKETLRPEEISDFLISPIFLDYYLKGKELCPKQKKEYYSIVRDRLHLQKPLLGINRRD